MAGAATRMSPVPPASGKTISKNANIALWVAQALVAAMFFMAGGMKMVGPAESVQGFEKIGLGQWFRYFTGALEFVGAVLLLIPGRAAIGASLLACVMVGAVISHLTVLGGSPAAAAGLLVATAAIAWFRRADLPGFRG